jgi:phage N-6-adenine-methyltransferase
MDSADLATLFSSTRGDWETPPALFKQLDRLLGPFTLDAAASSGNSLCKRYISDNALAAPWRAKRVWLNPPYGRDVGLWVKKAYEEVWDKGNATLVACLLPARTDTQWWHDLVLPHASEVHLIKGRVGFLLGGKKQAPAPFPSAVVVFASYPIISCAPVRSSVCSLVQER